MKTIRDYISKTMSASMHIIFFKMHFIENTNNKISTIFMEIRNNEIDYLKQTDRKYKHKAQKFKTLWSPLSREKKNGMSSVVKQYKLTSYKVLLRVFGFQDSSGDIEFSYIPANIISLDTVDFT